MKKKAKHFTITKASGLKVPFNRRKLRKSLLRAGASDLQADEIINEVTAMLVDGMSTSKIHKAAFRLLKGVSRPLAARYRLKQALLELGPSGFPFERYVAELLQHHGYHTQVGVFVQGHCVSHEVDIIAENEEQRVMVECKFHNRPGYVCDVKIPLYIQSRFLDIATSWSIKTGRKEEFKEGWLITNTRFSEDAARYGNCMNLHLVSWDYPKNNAIKDWIDQSGLHPVTSLTTLTHKEKQQLLERRTVLCTTIRSEPDLLEQIGVKPPRLRKVMEECEALCQPLSSSVYLKK